MAELSEHMSATAYHGLSRSPRRNKYHVAPPEQRLYKGIVYHSAREAQKACDLDVLQQAGVIQQWARQVPYPLSVNGYFLGKYVADFVVVRADTTRELIEVKGVWTPSAKLKFRLFLALYEQDWAAKGWLITVEGPPHA